MSERQCKGCNKRTYDCHTYCEKYKSYKKRMEDMKEKRHTENRINVVMNDLTHNMKTKRSTNGVRLGGHKK